MLELVPQVALSYSGKGVDIMNMYIHITENNSVGAIWPEVDSAFPNVPIQDRFAPELLSTCIVKSDIEAVGQIFVGMIYNSSTGAFSWPPSPELPPEPEPIPEPTSGYTITEAEANDAYRAGVNSVD